MSGHLLSVLIFFPLLGVLAILLARGIRALRPWARTTAIVLSGVGLLGFPVGTAIHGYILYLLLCRKGKRLFAQDYADIIAATPQIQSRGSVLTWILLGLALALFLALTTVAFIR